MSKKPSENQKPGSKFPESYFRSSNAGATGREEDSLERRLFSLIRNELRRTTAQNEFATLENRIIRILRNEFVNDIMTEINTSNDEIATFFNRFIRSVPELSELGERVRSERAAREGEGEEKKQKGGSKEDEMKRKERHDSNGKHTFTGNLDETNLGVVLEMFRAPIQVTCRACEDMRRIIRSGRRMIREIQLIAAMRSDLHTLRRIEMKCVEELDHVRTPRYRRQVSSIGNWRQMFRRRWRNIQPSSGRDRGYYYVVFDRLDKPRILPRMIPKSTHTMVIRLRKRGKMVTCGTTSDKQSLSRWDESNAKAEITRIVQMFRSMRWGSLLNDRRSLTSESTVLPQMNVNALRTPPSRREYFIPTIFTPRNVGNAEGNTNPMVISPEEERSHDESSGRMDCEENVPSETTHSTESSLSESVLDLPSSTCEDSPSPVGAPSEVFAVSTPPAGDAPSFTVTLRVGSAAPQDVTVLLYSDRVVVASVAQRSRSAGGGWSGWVQRRWVLPQHVDAERLRCFLRDGTLVITVSSLPPDSSRPFRPDFVALGPPVREPFPYPRHL